MNLEEVRSTLITAIIFVIVSFIFGRDSSLSKVFSKEEDENDDYKTLLKLYKRIEKLEEDNKNKDLLIKYYKKEDTHETQSVD